MINRRFLNYKYYSSFLRDLNDLQISNDAIVFIQDESHPCIWTHGKEYMANTSTTSYENGTLTFGDGCGNTLFTISQDGGEITITDSEGNQSTTSYVLNSDFQRTVREINNNQLTAGDGITITDKRISTTYQYEFLEQEEFEALESFDNNTLYFVYEESDEQPSEDAWSFGDSFPIILT